MSVHFLICACLLCLLGVGSAHATPGDLDPDFGQGGVALPDEGRFRGEADRIALQPDGKIVVVATEVSCNPVCPTQDLVNSAQDAPSVQSPNEIIVSRFDADGSPDTTFGSTAGTEFIKFDDVNNPVGVAIQSDGGIVVAGSSHPFEPPPNTFLPQNLSLAVARLTASGDLDPTFGSGGKVTLPLQDTFSASVGGLALQGGKILVAGSITRFGSPCTDLLNGCRDYLLMRLTSAGSLDQSFAPRHVGQIVLPNPTGSTATDLGARDVASAVALQADGKIVLGGCSGDGFAVARYGGDGLVDNAFGGFGRVVTRFANNGFDCSGDAFAGYFEFGKVGMAVQADGKIIVAGYLNVPPICVDCRELSPEIPALVRYNPDGTLDTTFGSGGKVMTPIPSDDVARATAVVIQPDGKIVLGGRDRLGGFLLRYTANGQLDATFGSGGEVRLPLRSGSAVFFQPNALFIQRRSLTQGEILLAGRSDSRLTPLAPGVARIDAFTTPRTRVGTFAVAPAESIQAVHRPFLYSFSWTVPDPGSWHDLKTLELRVRDRRDCIIDVIYDATINRFSLLDPSNGQPGPRLSPGAHQVLSTRTATLHMANTAVVADGPTSPTVTLDLSLELKSQAVGHDFRVEVAATDVAGNATGFVRAGTLTVRPRSDHE